MAVENGLGGQTNTDEATTSKSNGEAEKTSSMNGHQEDSKKSKEDEKTNTVPFRKLFSFADSTDVLLMILGTIGSIGNGVCMPLMTVLFGELTDSFGGNQNDHVVDVVSKVCIKFMYLAVGAAVAAFLQVACWMVTGERQAARIRNLYLKTILRQDVAFFDKETNTGEVVGRMSGDTVLIQDAMGEKVGKFVQLISTFVGGFLCPSSYPSWRPMDKMLMRKAANVVEQTIGSIRTVASFTGEKQAITNYNKFLLKAYKAGIHEGLATGFGLGTAMSVLFCSYSLAIWFGAKMILDRGYNGGEVLNVIIAVLIGSMSLGQASPCMSAFAAGQAAAFKMFETIERKPIIDAYDTKGRTLDDIHGDVELRDVYFSYPSRPDEQIFNGFSLSIPSGTTTALVGQSGSGKSTVISLIERFYDPHAGEVLIDGINLKEFQLNWIRGKIGLVSQEPVLFASSIKENITYGKDGATTEEIRAAAELANAAKFIDKLPQGLDTMVGEHGTQLSGGQKQRIAIARAILKDPRILLLDEATSALDAESERVVQEALDRIMVNRTTVIVAHRLSTIRNADMIAVIHRGKMVEKGSHSELLKDPEGAYSQLIRLQEVNKESELAVDDQNKPEITVESFRQSSQRMSIQRSISRGSSGVGNSSRHSFSVSFGLPTGVNVPDIAREEPDTPSLPTEQLPEVPLRRMAYLNKPEIPVLIIGAIAAIMNGVILSNFRLIPARSYFFAVAGCKLIQRIRVLCFEKVVNMEVSWFDEPEHSSGAIGARLSADAASVRALVGDALGLMVENIASAVAGLLIAFIASWQLALIILVLLPLIGINGFVQVKFMKGFSADAKMMYEEASQVANDAVGSIRTVASFCAEEKELDSLRMAKQHSHDVFLHLEFLNQAPLSPDSSKAKTAAGSIFSIIDRKSKIDPSEESGMKLDDVKGEIELRHVSFKYPSRPDIQIFRDLNLTIHSGKTIALVGESGSGKSTVISLLQRFYDPESGHITLDGIEIQTLQLKWLRQQMGLVSQEPILFNETIRANIAYGKEGDATEAEIIAASELANAHKFISSLQQGYDTMVDEATSALDAESEKVVQDALDRIMVNRTTVVVAHRLSTIKNADLIAVVKNGVIVEKGKHEKLINIKDGFYASLVALHSSASTA
uniref:Uncharacterized protein n=1 Tax=Fagus sylvatica TaxID=28930 RepID=A0A2N9G6V4_FAGSY